MQGREIKHEKRGIRTINPGIDGCIAFVRVLGRRLERFARIDGPAPGANSHHNARGRVALMDVGQAVSRPSQTRITLARASFD